MSIKMFYAGETIDNNDAFDSKMHLRSTWTPPNYGISCKITGRMGRFRRRCKQLFKKKRGRSNLLPHHRAALRYLQAHPELVIIQCDMNLGPAVIEREEYIKLAYRDHLNDTDTYQFLTPFEAQMKFGQIRMAIQNWINKYAATVSPQCKHYMKTKLKDNRDPHSYLYLTAKVHKGLNPLKSRPISSCSGSLLEPLGQAVNKPLQPHAQSQPYYLHNSFELLQDLMNLGELPPNTYLFTADAKSMYTNLKTNHCCQLLNDWLLSKEPGPTPEDPKEFDPTKERKAIVAGLKILMKFNIMKFGDLTILQKDGTAMGTPPAPSYAQATYGIWEMEFVPKFQDIALYYKRYIDDVFGIITLANPAAHFRWDEFKTQLQAFPGLKWDIAPLTNKVDFLDLTISINKENRIHTTLYEKDLNLHLYLPPHSAHPPGVLLGLIHGNVRRIYKLCSDPTDRETRTKEMFQHLLARGYKAPHIRPIFNKAIQKSQELDAPPAPVLDDDQPKNLVFFHLRYHPDGPKSSDIQQIWRETVSHPPYETPLEELQNYTSSLLAPQDSWLLTADPSI